MKNLGIYDVSAKTLKVDSGDNICVVCYGHSEGNSCGQVIVCTHNLIVTNCGENDEFWSKNLNELASPNNAPVKITFMTLNNSVCVGLSNGELFTIDEGGANCDLAGVCDHGLLAMEWSPDQELLVLVTKELNTILMSYTFDPVNEVNLLAEEFGEKQFITVGWGKKETQFHGSEGKQAAKAKKEVNPVPNSVNDDRVKISWRGDGQLYAIGFLANGVRRFKVFDREGQLQYTSEMQPGLESNLSWRPSGNVIATTQRLPNKYVVAFFEKNGLAHGDFEIPVTSTTIVEDMMWSSDSEVLALKCLNKENNTNKILIFTTANYHWYLKQTLSFDDCNISNILWDNDFEVTNYKKLHVILNNGEHYSYNWIWGVNHSHGTSNDDDAVVAVIDGRKILLTGFRQTVVPPPMCALEVELETQVNSVHFSPKAGVQSNSFFVCTTDSKLFFYEQTSKFPLNYERTQVVSFEGYKYPFQCYNWYWLNDCTITCIQLKDGMYSILEFKLDEDKLNFVNSTLLPSAVTRVHHHPTDSTKLFVQLDNGEILDYTAGGEITPQDISFNTSCAKFNVVTISNNLYFLGLSHKGNFYINDCVVMNNVSSFYVHTDFLLLTTLSHVLLSTRLTELGINAIKDFKRQESFHVYQRKIERGSKLVIAVPNDTRTVLQMPRGNLEAIQPRPLSLQIIGRHLDNKRYHEAFDLMRKQRINLNLIYDHNPDLFLDNVNVFLEEIRNNNWLSLFLSDLENADVTMSMYKSAYADQINNKENCSNKGDKINQVCDIIRKNLEQRADKDNYVLPFITTFVKKNNTEELEKALTVIKDLKRREVAGEKLPVSTDEALKYLLYMVDVNELFQVALGMYDFDLVLLVANKSQKDPKEYIPMLNEFNDMEENFKKFSINKHLKRFDRAVDCLAKCGVEKYAELRSFVKYHSLYRKALELFTPDAEIFKQISDDYGLYLKLKKQFTEAGLVYRTANHVDQAISCFKTALEWQLALELSYKWPEERQHELYRELVQGLMDEKRYKEALTILEQFQGNPEETITCAIECVEFKLALRLCSQHNREDIKEYKLIPALVEEYNNLSQLIESKWTQFLKHKERLKVVRENKKNAPVDLDDTSFMHKDSDLFSDAGSTIASTSSKGSSRSFRSSKNRRKHERKVASLKEGSQYEDVALVMALHNLVTSALELRGKVKEVNVALCCVNKYECCTLLQKSLDKLLKDMKDSAKDIWTNELVLHATQACIEAENAPEGSTAIPQGITMLEPHKRISPVFTDVSWKLEGL